MNNTIALLDQQEMDSSVDVSRRGEYYVRRAVRAVLSDQAGRAALMYARQRDYYKLPGGGVDEGEDLHVALARELLEEVGSAARVTDELGEVVEWRDFEAMKQVSYAFIAITEGELSSPNLTQSEIDEGFEVRWVNNLDEAIRLVEARANHEDMGVLFMSRRDVAILKAAKAMAGAHES